MEFTPSTFREVEICDVLVKSISKYTELKTAAQHDIVLLILVSTWVIIEWKFKEKWFEE